MEPMSSPLSLSIPRIKRSQWIPKSRMNNRILNSQSDPHQGMEFLQVEIPLIAMNSQSQSTKLSPIHPFLILSQPITANGQALKNKNTKEPLDSWKSSITSISRDNMFWTTTNSTKPLKTSIMPSPRSLTIKEHSTIKNMKPANTYMTKLESVFICLLSTMPKIVFT